MPIESADDLAVFFDAEEFGEAITYDGVGGYSAIWNRPTEDMAIGGGAIIVATNTFVLPSTTMPTPAAGRSVVTSTGVAFLLAGEPRLSRDGSTVTCEAVPAR